MNNNNFKQRVKILVLILSSLCFLLIALLIGSKLILLDSFLEIEEKSMQKNMDRVLFALQDELAHLDAINGDYAGWNESYRFIQDGNKDFIEANLPDSIFPQLRLNMMIYITNGGRILFERYYDLMEDKPIPAPHSIYYHINPQSQLIKHPDPGSIKSGVLQTPEGLLLISSRPVLTNEYEGPIYGSLIIGRYLDSVEVEKLSHQTQISVAIQRLDNEYMPPDFTYARERLTGTITTLIHPLNDDVVAAYGYIKDVYGKVAFILKVDSPRTIYKQGRDTIFYFLVWFFIAGIVFSIISYLLFDKLILLRRKGEETEERYRFVEEKLMHDATHDSLTDLPNQNLLQDRFNQAVAYQKRKNNLVAIMVLDLDHFKIINDTLGHAAGDVLLIEVARRLKGSVRDYDTVARLSGDEFVIIITDVSNTQDIITIAKNIMNSFATPFNLSGQDIFITSSIGISIYPSDGDTLESLLMKADTAMFHSKGQGRNNYHFFAEEMNKKVKDRLVVETSLRRAIERDELILHYQPRVDLSSGHITAVEALLRWDHMERGMIQPLEFIPLAEETGLIVPIGEWVLNNACRQNKIWHDNGFPFLRVAVNLSARQFAQEDMVEVIENILKDTGLDPHFLELELTESILMEYEEKITRKLHALKKMGVILSLDDFGTGYSSLSYLKRFPLDTVKIDKSFVQDITKKSEDAGIVKAILAMAQSLKLRTVAEGVEDKDQLAFLIEHHCDEMQGYYFSRPVPAESLTGLLRSGKRLIIDYSTVNS